METFIENKIRSIINFLSIKRKVFKIIWYYNNWGFVEQKEKAGCCCDSYNNTIFDLF